MGSATTNFDYYADGKKKSASYPNGAKEEYEYYPTNRVKTLTNSLNSAVISKFDYSYDRNGNRLNQDETRGSRSISTGYTYDSLDRMASYSVTENSATTRTDYTFDGYNRKTETTTKPDSSNITRTYSYDETDWLIQVIDGTKTIDYIYDNNGNTQQKSDSTDSANPIIFEYAARDKLTRTTKGATILGSYAYNAAGYRIRQNNSDRGNVDYLYDGTAVIEERNAGGLLAHYRYAGKLYSLFDGTSSQYYHQDALGSTVDLTDDAGTTKASYFLNPWGMIVDSIGSSVNRRIFTGKEIDQNTGLIYFGARYFDPDTARFTTQDEYLGKSDTPPSLHRYLYCYSNPTVYIDPDGHAVTLPPLSEENKAGYVNKGYLYTQYETAQREWQNPNNSIPVRAAYLGLATATAPVALPEEHIVRPLLNAPNTVYNSGVKIGEHAARAKFKYDDKDYAGAFEEGLHVVQHSSEGFVAGVSVADPLVEYMRLKPGKSQLMITKESVKGEVTIIGKPIEKGGRKPGETMPNGQVAGAGPGAALKNGAEFFEGGESTAAKRTDYSHIVDPKNVNASTKPTPRQVREMKAANRAQNGGELRSDLSGEPMVDSAKSQKGVIPPANEAQVDHIVPVDQGGTRTQSNLQLLTREENRTKWNK